MSRAPMLLALASVACGSPALTGGEPAPAGREPAGRRIASYRTSACVDAGGGALTHPTRAYLAEDAARQRMLVVSRPSYDSIVVRQPRTEGAESVFQVILEDGNGARVLHDFRVPASGSGSGRMAVATEFSEASAESGKVVAKVLRIAFACQLSLEEAAP